MESNIYWSLFQYKEWKLYITATTQGLCFVGSQNRDFEELTNWANKKLSKFKLIKDDEKLLKYVIELKDYLEGKKVDFSMPLDLHGTEFQKSVWNALQGIPHGHTLTYSEIAEQIQKPSSVRAVGTAIGANPVLITIPCHRVIGKNGTLTGYRGGLAMKKQLLEIENRNLTSI